MQIYTDCSVDYIDESAGIGYIITENNSIVYSNATDIEYCSTVKAEWKAIINAIEYAKSELHVTEITVYTDCHSIVEVIRDEASPQSDIMQGMYWNYTQITNEITITVNHIHRSKNCIADHLAKKGRKM